VLRPARGRLTPDVFIAPLSAEEDSLSQQGGYSTSSELASLGEASVHDGDVGKARAPAADSESDSAAAAIPSSGCIAAVIRVPDVAACVSNCG
jgi:hypothetical protein